MTVERVGLLIADLGKAIGLPDLAFDEDGYLCLVDKDGLVLNIDYYESQDCLVMVSTLGEIPKEYRPLVHEEMLKANFMWNDTLGATLCVDPSGGFALLMASITVGDLDLPKLLNVYDCIGRLTLAWHERVRIMTGRGPSGALAAQDQASPLPPFKDLA